MDYQHLSFSSHRVIPLSTLLDTSVRFEVLEVDPASQAAASKFCNEFAAGLGPAFWRSSNSAFSSGSTVVLLIRKVEMKEEKRTVIHKIRHPENDQHAEACNENHWVLEKA
jgi:hypothetical protein